MKNIVSKAIGVALGISLSIGIGISIGSNFNNVSKADAAVGAYSDRNQATYYTSAFSHKVTSSSYGTTLLNTLHELMYDSHAKYNTYDDLWTYTKDTDYDIDNPNNIILIYSRQSIDGTPTASSWNREHVWCKSLSGGLYTSVSSSSTGAGADLHHLRPASTAYNSTRGNTPYGVVSTHSSSTRMGDTDCYADDSSFEPADYIKGDVARILMYMYAHYSTEVSGTSSCSGALAITNIVNAGNAQACWDLLMDWNESDPVDYQEMIRNNKCAYLLGNYNPFIDHPEFARMIWDDDSNYQAGLFFQTSYKTVNVGSSYTNVASKYGRVSSSGDVVYTSDNPSVATVNSSTGQVTGVSNGVARIKARTTINGVSKISYHFVVVGSGYTPKYTMNASGIVYTPISATSARASETIGSETVSFNNTYTTAKYHTQMTAGKTATLTITNFPKTIKSIILSMHSTKDGGTASITISVGGSSYSSKSGTFASIYGSYSQSYVPIDMTNSSASKKTGTIVITIANTGSSKSIYFEKAIVDYIERSVTKATAISVSPSSASLTPGEDSVLTTSFTPSNTTLQTVTWSSSNNNVATVNKYGLVRAIAKGNATITATAGDGSGVTGTTSISVVDEVAPVDPPSGDPTVTSVIVSPSILNLDLYNNLTGNLSATVNGTNNPSQTVTWTSGNSNIATVNSSGQVTAVGVGTTTVTAKSTLDTSKSGTATINVSDSSPVISSISASVSKTYYVGDAITSSDITVKDNNNAVVENFTFSNDNYQFTYSDASSGGNLTNKTFTNSITALGKTCSLTVQVQRKERANVGSVSDQLDRAYTGQSGNTYGTWTSKAAPNSSAVYSGHNAGSNGSIQLRSSKTSSTYNAGVISTVSGGVLKNVSVTWNNNTQDGRVLNVYGKNTAYSTPNDLYDSGTRGTLLGTIVKGTSTTLNVTGSYLYVGVCSKDGAMYLTNITFSYGQDDSAINLSNYIMYEDTNGQCNSKFSVAKGYFEGLSSTERNTFMTSNNYVILSARTRLLDWAKHLGKTITYEDGDYVISNSKIVSPIDGIIRNNNNSSSVIVILSLIGITTFCGYIFLRKRKER